jgi:hypothetical protein
MSFRASQVNKFIIELRLLGRDLGRRDAAVSDYLPRLRTYCDADPIQVVTRVYEKLDAYRDRLAARDEGFFRGLVETAAADPESGDYITLLEGLHRCFDSATPEERAAYFARVEGLLQIVE